MYAVRYVFMCSIMFLCLCHASRILICIKDGNDGFRIEKKYVSEMPVLFYKEPIIHGLFQCEGHVFRVAGEHHQHWNAIMARQEKRILLFYL